MAHTLTDSEYHALSAALLAGIEAQVDRWLQDDVVDIDAARTGGLLELSLPGGSKIVINTQRDTKDAREFYDRLSECASAQAGQPLRFVSA